ncbi:ABC transporter ATP-binding protein [Nonomuraea jiangxiensis]|uniref:Peptide/nickel transport system ATP-binding protein n=1 Tax=Nonomuraea jiangxiensis TaxID=633440 RepID=A0A1G9BXL2_9ACTN|nr:ATP-binding cassette domain-containing protein [Nonomuraea jiangxiensis]SDK44130.1 peptide/nickel transport system ATP-binding protein [Nonomuraea jiangxiensis]
MTVVGKPETLRLETARRGGEEVARIDRLALTGPCGVVVVDAPPLTARRGRVVALVGPSGIGKTTMLRALLGSVPDGLTTHAARVSVLGRQVFELDRGELRRLRREHIGLVDQDPASRLNPYMRVRSLLAETAGTRDPARLLPLLRRVCLPVDGDLLRRRPRELSGGQQRRLALARALARRPALLLLDEPTAGLDEALACQIGRLVRDLAREEDIAVVVSTHDEQLVADAADTVVDLRGAHRPPAAGGPREPVHGPPVLAVRGLTALARPGGRAILSDVGLELRRGEAQAVIGPSGAGKTTLARALTGLHPHVNGDIALAGEPVPVRLSRRTAEQRRRIQLVPQDPLGTLNPVRTVGDILARPLRLHRRARPEDVTGRVRALLEDVALPASCAAKLPGELSGGQRQRVALARALAAEPEVLVCDEVTSALDTVTATALLELLTRLRAAHGLAVVMISHDLELVARYCDIACAIEDGKVAWTGGVAALSARR